MSPASVAAVGGAAVATTTSMLFFAVAGAAGLCAAAAIATGRAATAAAAAATQMTNKVFLPEEANKKSKSKAGVPVFFADLCKHPIHLLVQRSTFPLRRLLLELDIQAFGDSGVLLYEMLYGYTLFGGIPHKGSAVRNCQQAGLIKHLCKEGKSYVFLIILEYRSELRPQDIVQPRTIPA